MTKKKVYHENSYNLNFLTSASNAKMLTGAGCDDIQLTTNNKH